MFKLIYITDHGRSDNLSPLAELWANELEKLTVAESGQYLFSSLLEKKGIFSDCGPKIDGGDGGGVRNKCQRQTGILSSIPQRPGGVKTSAGSNYGEVIQELYINKSLRGE